MEATSRQPAALSGLSRFLVTHEGCAAGFDVSHPAGVGSGRLAMTCRSCGATYEYATATIEFEREIELSRPAPTPIAPSRLASAASKQGAAPRAGARPKRPGAPPSPPGKRRRLSSRARDRAIVAGLLVFAFAALAFAGLRIAREVSGGNSATPVGPSAIQRPQTTKPAAQPATAAPRNRSSARRQAQATTSPAQPVVRQKSVRTALFSLRVPSNWAKHAAQGGLTLSPASSAGASVRVFYESNPSMSIQTMSAKTADFLRSRASGGAIVSSKRLRIGDHPGFLLRDHGPAGSETALGVLAGPYRYLVVARVKAGANASARSAAIRALHSFRPR